MDPHDIFEAVIYIHSPCPTSNKRAYRGLVLCRDRTSIVARAAVCCAFLCAGVRVRALCIRGDFAHLGERATLKLMLHIIGWQAQY